MKLNQTLIDALVSCGATETEMASITAYYADQLTVAQANVAQIEANIESLQTQLAEAKAHAQAIEVAIGKYVVPDPVPEPEPE